MSRIAESKKPFPRTNRKKGFSRVRDKIRTRDLLVRSQTLYPAELRTHIFQNVAILLQLIFIVKH